MFDRCSIDLDILHLPRRLCQKLLRVSEVWNRMQGPLHLHRLSERLPTRGCDAPPRPGKQNQAGINGTQGL